MCFNLKLIIRTFYRYTHFKSTRYDCCSYITFSGSKRFLALISTMVPGIFNEEGFVKITHRLSEVNYLHMSIHFFSIGIVTETESYT